MCQRLYLASRAALPPLKHPAESPGLTIGPLAGEAASVRRWFSADATQFAEALASPCGCGFPEFNAARPAGDVSGDEGRTVHALTTYLEGLGDRRYVAELLLCWVGDERERPRQRREITLETLRSDGFRFRRGEVLRLRR